MFALYCRLDPHVYDSDRSVLRRLYARWASATRFDRARRDDRHALARAILEQHRKARELFDHFRF